jgi:hypothetical protein
MRAILKWFLVLLAVLYLTGLVVYNLEIVRYRVTFAVPVPVFWPPHLVLTSLPEMSLGIVMASLAIAGALVTGLAASLRLALTGRDLRKARRRIADLEAETVSYRGRAAREAEPGAGESAGSPR